MQVITRILAAVLLICAALALPAPPAGADAAAALTRALAEMRSEDWDQAARKAGPRGSLPRDIVEWHRLRAGLGSPADILAFLDRRPDWPGLDWLRRKSELSMATAGIGDVLKFYGHGPAQTAEGALSHAKALLSTGQQGDGEAEIVLSWRTRPMGRALHDTYLKRHGSLLKPHHTARLDRLLWDGHLVSARRMLPLVPESHRKLAEARIALQETAPGVDARIAAVPEALRADPGLAYDRFAWRDRKRRQEDAIALMINRSASAETLGEPGKWARRRRDLARQLMRDRDYERAYQLAAYHHATPEIGYSYADLEWIAGYVALRFLDDPKTAVAHFQRFEAAVTTPISKGRAGYWLGRAHAAADQPDLAHGAYDMGARYQTSFYGLLAAEQIGRPFDPELASPPAHPDWRDAPFMDSSVTRAGLLLLEAEELALAERFLTHLVETLPSDQAEKLGAMAVDLGQPHLALMIAKRAARSGQILHEAYYPMHPVADQRLPMAREMTLSIARRESEFDPVVISGAGARGLMQVMPATARLVATELGILSGHATSRLTGEWKYNAKLGANYLAGLAADFDGNVVMMAAGYNAGPNRPITWMQRYGDPRDGSPDIVDWIEHIPFNETRNYIMRVTESLPVYRARLGQEPLPVPFSRELVGSTLRAFAP